MGWVELLPVCLDVVDLQRRWTWGLADLLQQRGQKLLPSASESNVILCLESVFAACCAYTFLGEVSSIREIAGGAMIVFAAILASRWGHVRNNNYDLVEVQSHSVWCIKICNFHRLITCREPQREHFCDDLFTPYLLLKLCFRTSSSTDFVCPLHFGVFRFICSISSSGGWDSSVYRLDGVER